MDDECREKREKVLEDFQNDKQEISFYFEFIILFFFV